MCLRSKTSPETPPIVIAIDGPSHAGKITIARKIASELQLPYINAERLFKAVAWLMLRRDLDPKDVVQGVQTAKSLPLDAVDRVDIEDTQITKAAATILGFRDVRSEVLDFQRRLARSQPGLVMSGHDIGTVVCKNADVKIYVTAKASLRAHREFLELKAKGKSITEKEVLRRVISRDDRYLTRDVSPLEPAEDAHILDTTDLSTEEAYEAAMKIVGRDLSTNL